VKKSVNNKRAIILSSVLAASLATSTAVTAQEEGGGDDKEEESGWSMADKYYGKEEMERSRASVQKAVGGMPYSLIMADRFELQSGGGSDNLLWDAQGYYGGDINKLWIKTEGDYSFTEDMMEDAEVQALWSRAVSSFFDLQAGVRYDFEPEGLAHAVIGMQGLAPYWFEVDAAAFISEKGDITASLEAEYELLLTQRLILQPRLELGLSLQDINERSIAAGLTDVNLGLRLRYEVKREFAPYVGIDWQRSLGGTANRVRAAGGDASRAAFVVGIRAWY